MTQSGSTDISGNTYKAVKIREGATGKANTAVDKGKNLCRKLPWVKGVCPPEVPTIPTKSFVAGEKLYVTKTSLKEDYRTQAWDNAVVNGALPTSLGGVSVGVAGKPAYISYISPGQINFLALNVSLGSVAVTVTTAAGTSAPYNSIAGSYGPAFFLIPGNQPVATHLDYTLAAKNGTYAGVTTVLAQPGELSSSGVLDLDQQIHWPPDGMGVPSQATYSTAVLPSVIVSSQPARVHGAALAPGFAGLYQIAIQLQSSLPNCDLPISASVGGMQSETGILLTVKAVN